MTCAYYNEYGDITSVCSVPNMEGDYVEVPTGTHPDQVWIDPATGEIHEREAHEWPEMVAIEHGLAIPAHVCCATFINGEKQSAGTTFIPETPGRYVVEIKGRRSGTRAVMFASYAEQRKLAYPSIADQLDLIYHAIRENGDLSAWFDQITAIKEAYPKS